MTRSMLTILFLLTASPAFAEEPRGPREPFAADLGGPLVGSLEISNERHRPIQVYVDGRFATEVAPKRTEIIPDVPNGVRLVAYGSRGERFQVDKVEVRVDRRAAVRIAPQRGVAVIHNDTRVAMRVKLGDHDVGVIPAGEDFTSGPLAAGTYTVSYLPREVRDTPARNDRVEVVAGETAHLALRAFHAELVVANPFPFEVSLFLDGKRVGRIDGRDTLALDRLKPAKVVAELRRERKLMAETQLELRAGEVEKWSPVIARYGDLEVRNPGRAAVRVRIGELSDFRLMPGEARFFSNLESGSTTIAVSLPDGRVIRHVTEIRAGDRMRFEVPADD